MRSSYMQKAKLFGFIVILGLLTAPMQAETKRRKLWRVSVAVLGAVSIADMHSSMGRRESNAFLQSSDGRFHGRGIALKSLTVGSVLGAQWFLVKKNPNAAGYAAAANFAASAFTGAVVVHNHMLK
jgi:hypothetical protein